jgi:hypothetical protein
MPHCQVMMTASNIDLGYNELYVYSLCLATRAQILEDNITG